jgi:hypothetical protein
MDLNKIIGHTLRKPQGAVERHTLYWNPQGTKKRTEPRTTWKRIEREMQKVGKGWREVKRLALDRTKWKNFKKTLRSTQKQKEGRRNNGTGNYTLDLCG